MSRRSVGAYGSEPRELQRADAIEVVVGHGAKPSGMILGQKVSERAVAMRTLPSGIDRRSASLHPDWTEPDDLTIKINELREATATEVDQGRARPAPLVDGRRCGEVVVP